jgi:hypothetical protein
MFHAIYGSPIVQALAGVGANDASPRKRLSMSAEHRAFVTGRIAEIKARLGEGGAGAAAIRALLHIRMADGAADERSFGMLRRLREEHGSGMSIADFKHLVREQFYALLVDEERAVAAIPAMLGADLEAAKRAGRNLRRLVEAVEPRSEEARRRASQIEAMFLKILKAPASDGGHLSEVEGDTTQAKRTSTTAA